MSLDKKSFIGMSIVNNYWISNKHLNPQNDLFGGTLVGFVDETIAMLSIKITCRKCVTASIENMTFVKPVKVGDILEVTATVQDVRNTSMNIKFEVNRINIYKKPEKVSFGNFIMVVLDENNKPTTSWNDICYL